MAHGHAVPASIKNAIYDVVTTPLNGQARRTKRPVAALAAAVKQ